MKTLFAALVYTALALGANAALAADLEQVAALREGDMKKLVFHEAPKPVSDAPFAAAEGDSSTLADYRGKWVLLNFWATWCAPCRKEMPQLAALQEEFGGDRFEVVTVATGRNSPDGIARFFKTIEVENLPRYQDGNQKLARDMAVLGLPITVLIDPEGREVARLRGDADWYSDSARAIVAALAGSTEG